MEEKDLIAEEETSFITLTDENGVEAEFEFMECIEYQGKEYIVLTPAEEDAAEILRLNVTKTSVPQFSVETAEYRRGNDVVKFATVPTWESGTLEVDDIVGVNTKDILISWLYLAYNPHTRMGGRMKDYKKTAILQEYTQDYELVREWEIQGIFIKKVTDSEFDRENDSKRKVSVEFEYDRALLTDVTYGVKFK